MLSIFHVHIELLYFFNEMEKHNNDETLIFEPAEVLLPVWSSLLFCTVEWKLQMEILFLRLRISFQLLVTKEASDFFVCRMMSWR